MVYIKKSYILSVILLNFKDRDSLSNEDYVGYEVGNLILEHGSHSFVTDRKPSFKVESNVPVQQLETSSEQPIVYGKDIPFYVFCCFHFCVLTMSGSP